MNLVLKCLGKSVAFLMIDSAITIFFEHQINIKEKLINFVLFFFVILLLYWSAPKLRKLMGFEKKSEQA